MDIFSQEALEFIGTHKTVFVLLFLWSLFWKGLALWKSSRLSHNMWFIIILVVNTLGILDIIYIFLVANRFSVESRDST